MTARIFTGDEAAALLADYTATPRITFGDECLGGVPLCVDGRELLYTEGDDTEGDWIYVDRWEAAMHDAAPDLAASVEHHAARADAAEASVHQLTIERDGARAEVVRLRAELDASRDRELTLDKLAPRAELPTPAEVLAVAEERDGDNSSVVQVLCAHTLYGVTGAMYTVAAVAVRGGVVQAITEEAAENLRAADGFILLAHEGPVPWAWLTPLPPPARPFGLVINSEIADAIDGARAGDASWFDLHHKLNVATLETNALRQSCGVFERAHNIAVEQLVAKRDEADALREAVGLAEKVIADLRRRVAERDALVTSLSTRGRVTSYWAILGDGVTVHAYACFGVSLWLAYSVGTGGSVGSGSNPREAVESLARNLGLTGALVAPVVEVTDVFDEVVAAIDRGAK